VRPAKNRVEYVPVWTSLRSTKRLIVTAAAAAAAADAFAAPHTSGQTVTEMLLARKMES
jgi:H+/Cl- antiporter ClcA